MADGLNHRKRHGLLLGLVSFDEYYKFNTDDLVGFHPKSSLLRDKSSS